MTDYEIKLSFEEQLNALALQYGINHLVERDSYFRYVVKNGVIEYRLPDMEHNDFMIGAIKLASDFLKDKN